MLRLCSFGRDEVDKCFEFVSDFFCNMYINNKARQRSLLRQLQFKRGTLSAWDQTKAAFYSTHESSVMASSVGSLSDTITNTFRNTMNIFSSGAGNTQVVNTIELTGTGSSSQSSRHSVAGGPQRKRGKRRHLHATGVARPRVSLGRTWRTSLTSGSARRRPKLANDIELPITQKETTESHKRVKSGKGSQAGSRKKGGAGSRKSGAVFPLEEKRSAHWREWHKTRAAPRRQHRGGAA